MIVPALASLVVAATAPDPAALALEAALAASKARTAEAEAERTWQAERERLEALVAMARAEAERQRTEAATARSDAERLRATAPPTTTLPVVQETLRTGAARVRAALADLARRLPPGAVAVPTEDSAEAVAAALAASERAAGAVAVEVISGVLRGQPRAAKVLRVAGARAWWLALDGQEGGTVAVADGIVTFTPVADPRPIAAALAAVEGRGTPRLELLPEAR